MSIQPDNQIMAQTCELGQARLRLRNDLKFTLHNDAATQWYLVEDESRCGFYRVGIAEYAFLSLLNGKRTLDEAVAKLSSLSCCDDLSEQRAVALARWVVDSGLAQTATSNAKERIGERRKQEQVRQITQWMNPIAVRFPLFNPDLMLSKIYALGHRVIGWPVFCLWLMVCIYGGLTLVMVWGQFWDHQVSALSSMDMLYVAATWMLLKVFHEGAHGLVCKHYGGRVPEFGVLLLLLIPLPYVDVSSSWRFTGKSQRIVTAAAGMLAEMFIASIAIVLWAACSPGPLKYHAGNLFIAASVHTLLFNANPLMKFDGYYMLIDALEIPNLYTRGQTFVKSFCKWLFFGISFDRATEASPVKNRIVRIYGGASFLWMVLICVGLATAAVGMFSGFGLLIALAGSVFWIGLPLMKLGRYLFSEQELENPNKTRFWGIVGSGAAVLALLAAFAPAPGTVRAPMVIQYDDMAVVRTRTAGFVTQLHVVEGQQVTKGAALVTMINPELLADVQRIEAELASAELRANAYRSTGDISSWKIEYESIAALEKQLSELRQQQQQLHIIAPQSGIVVAADLEQLDGAYLKMGDEVISVGSPESVHALALVDQADAAWLRQDTGDTGAWLKVWGTTGGGIEGRIDEVSPRATNHIPHFSFASNYGGPLSTVSRSQVESRIPESSSLMRQKNANMANERISAMRRLAGTGNNAALQAKLIRQCVPVKIKLSAADARRLMVGQTGCMLARRRDECLGSFVWSSTGRWLSSKIFLTHGL